MAKTALYNMEGAAIGEIELSDAIFASDVNVAAMHLVVRSYLAAQRQGTQSAKTRTEVRGGGRKIYRQKGTGNARHHGNRAPQFRHGGVVFAPKPRDYVIAVPKKVRRLAFKSALTSKLNDGDIIVVDELTLSEGKTKLMANVLKKLGAEKKALVVLPEKDENVVRATANLPQAMTTYVNTLNVYDILNAGKVVLTKMFLPQLLQAASAAQSAFEEIKTAIAQKGEGSASKGRIVLATVKGDVHDIGKNIVRVILENYGFEVLDLGRDVPVETVVDTVREKDVHLVGLSALMTTTLKSMEETIAALHAAQLDCKIMVGGAVLTPEYAEKIGADWYAKDAKRSADIAKEFFGV